MLTPKMFCLNFGTGCNRQQSHLILVEEVVRIQIVVAEELPAFAVELLRAALESKAERGSGSNTVIRRIVAGQYLELRDGVHRRHDAHAAGAAAVICFRAIQQPDVMALAKAVHADAWLEAEADGVLLSGRLELTPRPRAASDVKLRFSVAIDVTCSPLISVLTSFDSACTASASAVDRDFHRLGADRQLDVGRERLRYVQNQAAVAV